MYELVQAATHTYYIESPAKIGIVEVAPREVVLIDSGGDRSAGSKVRRILSERGWQLKAIYNTHSHADHTGGNHYLQSQTGCRIFSPGAEGAFTKWPWLEPSYLFGAKPPKELRHKFLVAQESEAEPLTTDVLPDGWDLIDLPGHFFHMVGFRTPDDVLFISDCLSSKPTLDKYRLSFLYDVQASLDTLERVSTMRAQLFVPAHAEATVDIAPLARYNASCIQQAAADIAELCANPICFDDLLAAVFTHYDLRMTFEQHALVGSTVRSYLTYLSDQGAIKASIDNNRWLWARA
ncbi:MAG: MBL fold metallo-hydrolase [Coriobacteriales bacterium]|nr:MBL fold metallo-hydrolase [Coriobacteriales bacterium]